MERYVLHCDVNSAYLSWIAAKRMHDGDPIDLRNVPSVVGGSEKSRHGIALAKSIPAKQYGIKTGESLMSIRQKCPGIIIIPPDYELFMKASQAMYNIICEYSPNVQRFSIDECFFDLVHDKGRDYTVQVAYELKDRILNELGFSCNIGIGYNKIQAKMGGELKKPNMVHTLWPEEIKRKLWILPVGELFMVGQKTEKKLQNLGIQTIGQLATTNIKILESHLKSYAFMIQAYANGRDDSPIRVSNIPVVKGIGNGCTSQFNVTERKDAYLHLMSLTESVGLRLREAEYCTGLVAIEIVDTDFVKRSKQRKLSVCMDSTTYIVNIAKELFDELWDLRPLRKFRVRVSDLHTNEYVQLSFLEQFDFEKQKCIDQAMDDIRNRYGGRAVQRACFIDSGIKSNAGGVVDEEEYPMMTSIL